MTDFETARRMMVEGQVRTADVTRRALIDAMLETPRERFVPRSQRSVAYADAPIPIAPGRTLLEARTFSKLLEAADVRGGDLVLDVGAGYGYSSVIAARLAAAVVALEEEPSLVSAARSLITELEIDNVLVEEGPLVDGAPASGPFDVILLEGAVAKPPEKLLDQLKDGGRLACIVREETFGRATVFTRAAGVVSSWRAFDAAAAVLPGFDSAPAFEF